MKTLKVAFATTISADTVSVTSAIKAINEMMPSTIDLCLRTGSDFNVSGALDDFISFSVKSDIVIVRLMGDLPDFDKLVEALKIARVPLMVSTSFFESNNYAKSVTVQAEDEQKIFFYLNYGGKKNFENLFYYLANRFTGTNYAVEPPIKPVWNGIYHYSFDHVPTLKEYVEKKIDNNRLTVGLWFHQSQWQSGNTDFIDAIIREVEVQGANVLPVFFGGSTNETLGLNGLDWVIENYFLKDGKVLVDVVVSLFSFSLSTCLSGVDAAGTLKKLGVPILKAITTCNTFEEWRDTMQGLNIMDIPSNVAMPEFDGALITVPVATMNSRQFDSSTGARIIRYKPIEERIKKVVCLALNWGRLRRLSNSQKKVAIIFHNYPPRNDTIGHAFGLDSSASVMNILQGLKQQGYTLDELPASSQELMDTIIAGLTNDCRWASPQDLNDQALDRISLQQYDQWFNDLPLKVTAKLEKDWGKRPGKIFTFNGKFLVAGIQNGNVYIGLQPPRGHLENSASIYHSPDLSISYHYHAYYRWIRDVFGANVIMHIGTHGSLEWLPGKSVGLSESCFPDIVISDLPNIYPYNMTVLGEGTQAKRRSYCCIIDHLIPVMHNADSYDELAKIEIQLQDYYHAKTVDPNKLPVLRNLIWENVVAANIDKDLNVAQDVAFGSFDAFLEQLHAYINELSDAQIRDGLHILGEGPKDLQLDEFLVTLTRLNNGDVPSLRQSIAELLGFDYDDLLMHRGKLGSDGKTNGDHLKKISALSLELIQKYHLADFKEEKITTLTQEVLGACNHKIERCLCYISSFLVPALASTTDELVHAISGCQGDYVLPGPSGSLTRGMADVLPTGRNFYSLDPRTVPTAASWEIGVVQANVLIDRYLKEEGKYPDSVGISIWATDTMKTKGDDIAEVLYLMGVKPVWEPSSGRVVGLAVIPLEDLKRPRIDVTMRISGLFRDTFPIVVNLLDEAVELVAGLKESYDQNFIAKHVETEVAEKTANGIDVIKAREEACYRIFGDRPGAYGCGVNEAIDSKNWRDQKDLSDIYITWGAYAYTRKTYGLQTPDQFKRCLKKISVAVKNQDSREYDILDIDDWYDFYGGLVNAVKVVGGKAPKSYCGDSSDPNRVKVRSAAEETCFVFRSRLLNPKFIEGMKKHGYQGAAELSRNVDFVFGWDATVDVVEDWMYEGVSEKYVFDKDMQQWLKNVNPYALQNMVERLLEAVTRDMWRPSDNVVKELQKLYLEVEGLLEGVNEKVNK
ncbi:MAG: cobaltochelatase subunit CobN [Nitrososphaerota archaeon]|jgi:cobaltochelatase CobN|nr:cobaltochelatase subunit CobN [Nitrososphaerota archaeon]